MKTCYTREQIENTVKSKGYKWFTDSKNKGYDVVVFDNVIDSHYINHLEQKLEKTQIKRVDADILDKLIDKGEKKEAVITEDNQKELKEIFEKYLKEYLKFKNYSKI